jgi:FlaA1/EpsC-like NDP-sugar epimerase
MQNGATTIGIRTAIRYRTALSILAHLALFTIALLLSFGLAYEFRQPVPWFTGQFLVVLPFTLLIKFVIFGLMHQYRGSWRYVGLRDLFSVVKASHLSAFAFVAGYYITENVALRLYARPLFTEYSFPQSVFLLDWLFTIAVVCSARMVFRFYHEEIRPSRIGPVVRLLIVGAGDAGEAVLREIFRMRQERYEVVGLLDDDPAKQQARIHGVEVLGRTDDIRSICEKHRVDEVLIAMPSAGQRKARQVVEQCQGTNLRFRTVPGLPELIDGRVQVSQIREVDIEDLLGRDPVTLDTQAIGEYLHGRRVLITGAGGSIGSEMCRQIARFAPARLILLERAENNLFFIERELRKRHPELDIVPVVGDIADAARMEQVFGSCGPQTIFHAAAHKHVPMMEINPGEAVKNNIGGTKMLADVAVRHNVEKFVMISTDKAVNPTSVMGCTKRVAELYVQQLSAKVPTAFVTVRFGNVLGSSGSVVPIFREQIAAGGPVTITHPEMRRYFMTIPEAAQLVLQAGAMGHGGEIFLLDMGEPVRIMDLAREMITLSGLRPGEDIEIVCTGMRPGEKLFEELSLEGEDVARTAHPKIGIMTKRPRDWDEVCRGISRLLSLANGGEEAAIRSELKALVPQYNPGNGWDRAVIPPQAASAPATTEPAPAAIPSMPSIAAG